MSNTDGYFMLKYLLTFFLSVLIIPVTCMAQIYLSSSQSKFKDEDKIKRPKIGFKSPYSAHYAEYEFSRSKEEKLKLKIKIIFDYDIAQKCQKLGEISTPDRVLASFVSGKTSCELSLQTLMDYAHRKGGDTLYISIAAKDCKLGNFQSYALKCNE